MPYYFIDRTGRASDAYSAVQWSELFGAAQRVGWRGIHPFPDLSTYDHWQLDQANITLVHKALERSRFVLKRGIPHTKAFRERRDHLISFLCEVHGDIWIEQLLVELCPTCGDTVAHQATFCVTCGHMLTEEPPPVRSPHAPAVGQTQQLE